MSQAAAISPSPHATPSAPGNGVVILANPYSGSGPNRKHVQRLEAALQDLGHTPHTVWSRDERQTLLSDPALPDRCGCVVSAGGDGSLSGVLNILDTAGTLSRVSLYHFPVGNENLFAAEVGHTRDPQPAAQAIARSLPVNTQTPEHRNIDLGRATLSNDPTHSHLFHLMLSAGFDAEVVRRMDDWRTAPTDGRLRRVSTARYVPRTLAALARYRYPTVTLTPHDGPALTGAHAFVFNLPRYGGGLRLGSAADYTDGQLDYLVLTRPGLFALARYGLTVLLNRHLKTPHIQHGRATQLTLQTDAPLQIDGDRLPNAGPLKITAQPQALRICSPARA
ncbi:MAG: diacylglycerol kinase family protein [Planctomycetota bacterium]